MSMQSCLPEAKKRSSFRESGNPAIPIFLTAHGRRIPATAAKAKAKFGASQQMESSLHFVTELHENYPDPKGGAHGCALFSDRARMASRKIPLAIELRAADVGQGISLVTFFVPAKKVTRREAEAFRLSSRTMRSGRPPTSPLPRRRASEWLSSPAFRRE